MKAGIDMSKKKKGNGALQSVGNHNGAKASPLLGGMFSNAGVVQAAVPLASAEILMAKFDAEATPEQRAKVETELRAQLKAEVAKLQSDRDELESLRASVDKGMEALKCRVDAFEAENEEAKRRVEGLAAREATLLCKEEELEVRERNARNGFFKQREENLKALRSEVDALELRKLAIGGELEGERNEARSRIQHELELRLGAIKSREEELDSRQLELDRRATELESKERKVAVTQRSREDALRALRKEVEAEFADEITRRDAEIVRYQGQVERMRRSLTEERERLDAYEELSEVLDGREPAALREELEELRQANRALNSRLGALEAAESLGELERVKEELDAARDQIRDLRHELEERKVSAHQQQLAVLER
ncbi:MAG: hypothetical protein JSR64_13930, partial [Nitrospira sp.]|nr:hypothetical protein [Nitrospira sp.]